MTLFWTDWIDAIKTKKYCFSFIQDLKIQDSLNQRGKSHLNK